MWVVLNRREIVAQDKCASGQGSLCKSGSGRNQRVFDHPFVGNLQGRGNLVPWMRRCKDAAPPDARTVYQEDTELGRSRNRFRFEPSLALKPDRSGANFKV